MDIWNEGTSIVMVGSWNKAIITPTWLKDNNITDLDQIQVEAAINNPAFPIRYKLEHVYLQVSQTSIKTHPIEDTEISYESAETVSALLLEVLNHTPISGVGYNFHLIEKSPSSAIIERFVFKDAECLVSLGGIVKQRTIKRQLEIYGKLLNLTMLLGSESTLSVDFNWHFNFSSANDAKGKMKDTFYDTYKQTKEMSEKLFT